jgi:hypothetical protein
VLAVTVGHRDRGRPSSMPKTPLHPPTDIAPSAA